ncbi:MAG: HlyD family secretion protein [Vicinamibacterales bacterium]
MTRHLRNTTVRQLFLPAILPALLVLTGACEEPPPADRTRVSGQIEATEVQVAPAVGGRILELPVTEGARVEAGAVVARLDTEDASLALVRARAERAQAEAQLRLLRAGPRQEDVRQAEAQLAAARAEQGVAGAELSAAQVDVDRFEALLASNSGSRKQRDDAVARRDVARERVQAARDRAAAAAEALARIKAGARREEIAAAEARVAAADAQISILEKAIADATVTAPLTGIVTDIVADAGELVAPRAPLIVITDLDRAWANVYVDEPVVPRLKIGQAATLHTDAGGDPIPGRITYISPKAEFTPRNVQTAQDRSQLVYRVKVSVDNTGGVLKSGMPVEAEMVFP